MQPYELSAEGRALCQNLSKSTKNQLPRSADKIHISGVGSGLYFAYEQLRNAAEYSERHLLLRRAIERFLHRNLNLRSGNNDLAIELISELTQARYIKNDTVPRKTLNQMDDIISRYVKLATAVRSKHVLKTARLVEWIFETASVELEHQLVEHDKNDALIEFAFNHYRTHIAWTGQESKETYDLAVYCAVHRILFKSDIATVRYYALAARLGPASKDPVAYFVQLNQQIDNLFQSSTTNRISRLVNRYGAPVRILRELVMEAGEPAKLLQSGGELLERARTETQQQYKLTRKRLNDGIIRSVLFIFITKVILGVSLEIPYDIVATGAIAWLPLTINTLIPPAYMATIGWGIRIPGRRNTEVIQSYLRRILYKTDDPPLKYQVKKRVPSSTLTTFFNVLYAVAFLLSFTLLIYALRTVGFNLMNGLIFFVFLSVVSFFGFRLLQTARELEIIDQRKSLISVVLDFFSTPFIRVGHWLSDKYSRINVVTIIMDAAIELPLKTSLRFLRQWAGFIRDKQEEL